MTDVLAFLAAVHDADEQGAREASGRAWHVAVPGTGWAVDGIVRDADSPSEEEAVHIARHDPQTVLARVEAERLVCDGARRALDEYAPHGGAWDHESETGRARSATYEDVLRALAWGYRHRDGWRAEWAPDGVEVGRE